MALKQKVQVAEKKAEMVVARSYQEMVELALKGQLDSISLNEKEVRILVDCLTEADSQAKELDKKVKAGKPVLLGYAKEHEQYALHGDLAYAKIADKTDFDLPASKAIKILEKEGKMKLLDLVLSVSVTKFREFLGSDLFEKNASREERKFATISLKKK